MQTATFYPSTGRLTVPTAIRRQYGWRHDVQGVITAYSGGFAFTFQDEKQKKQGSKKTMEKWEVPEPKLRGPFLIPVENWRELANDRPPFSDAPPPSNSVTSKKAREELDGLLERVSRTRQPVKIRGKNTNAFLISQEDFDGIVGTLELNAIPGMVESILEGGRTPHDECIPFEELGWDLKSN